MFWNKNGFRLYKEDIQIDTKIDQSDYKVSIDQSQARLLVYSLLVYFCFLLVYFLIFFIHVFNLFPFCEQNFLTMHRENNFLNIENVCSEM